MVYNVRTTYITNYPIIQLSNYPRALLENESQQVPNLINERNIMSIQYFIFEDNDDDQPFVFDAPVDNPLDGEDPEVGLSEYYARVNQLGNYL